MSAAVISIEEHRIDQVLPQGAAGADAKAALQALGSALKQRAYEFTTVTPLTHRRVNARASAAWAHDLPGIFGWSRPFKSAVPDPALLAMMEHAGVVEGEQSLRANLRASTLGGQLYFHSAFPTTAADAVFFGPDTYRFIRAMRTSLLARERSVRRAADIGGRRALALAPGALQRGVRPGRSRTQAVPAAQPVPASPGGGDDRPGAAGGAGTVRSLLCAARADASRLRCPA